MTQAPTLISRHTTGTKQPQITDKPMEKHSRPSADFVHPDGTEWGPRLSYEAPTQTDAASSTSLPNLRHPHTCQSWQGNLDSAVAARAQSSESSSAHIHSNADSTAPSVRETGDAQRPVPPSTPQFDGWERDAHVVDAAVVSEEAAGNSQPGSVHTLELPHVPEPRLPSPALTFDRRVSVDLSRPTWTPPLVPVSPSPASRIEDPMAFEAGRADDEGRSRVRMLPALTTRWLALFGRGDYGTLGRRALVDVVVKLGFAAVQFIVILTVLALGAPRESPTKPGQNEWQACNKPLGAWSILWLLRTMAACVLFVRTYQGKRQAVRFVPVLPALTFVWFFSAQLLVFQSLNSCRFSAPHLWWLTLSIICLAYCILSMLILFALFVLVVVPILLLARHISDFCIGLRQGFRPQTNNPATSKSPKSAVERIPLVLYIPAPPEEQGEIAVPAPVHQAYPPGPRMPKPQQRRFWSVPFSCNGKDKPGSIADDGGESGKSGGGGSQTWEENWQPAKLPFVRLASNQATCAICLTDFEEPPRARGSRLPPPPVAGRPSLEEEVGGGDEIRMETGVLVENADGGEVRPREARKRPQPLRLLGCGHVFHVRLFAFVRPQIW